MVDIIPKQKQQYPIWFRVVFTLSVTLFFASIISFFGLIYLTGQEEKRSETLQADLEQGVLKQQQELEDRIFATKKQIEDFSVIVEEREDFLSYFAFVEENVHPQVVFTQMNLGPELKKITLSAKADSFPVVDQQVQIMEENPLVEEVVLSGLGFADKGGVSFSLELHLSL